MVKKYLSLEGLTHVLNKLTVKFAAVKHTHTRDEITDLQNVVISAEDDGNGNVIIATDFVAGSNATYLVVND